MSKLVCLAAVIAGGCTAVSPVGFDPGEAKPSPGGDRSATTGAPPATVIPDVRCAGVPDAGPAGDFNNLSSEIIAALGDPQHRGFDLVAAASADTQTIEGWAAYTVADTTLVDEAIELFACRDQQWARIGTAMTDDDGHFALALSGADRLPIGLRDMYFSVVGDRTGAAMLAYVAPDDAPLLVSDVDGTLTSSENAFFETITLGLEPDEQPAANAALSKAAARGYQIVYVTARGNQYTDDTRSWLADKGFPRGPLRLATSFLTLPGDDTIDYKTQTIAALALPVAAGIGNRDSDVVAYTNVGLAGDRIFIKLPEYQDELQADLDAGKAIGFQTYDDLRTTYIDGAAFPPVN